jgi:DNA polymerase (family X)
MDTGMRVASKAARLAGPLRNGEIADRFDDIAAMLELAQENPFRIRAYRNASRLLRRYAREASAMIAQGDDLTELPGIGEDLAGKIRDLVETGTTPILETLKSETPRMALALMDVPGLGPKRIRRLTEELDLRTMAQLRRAARDERIRRIPGFGPKLERYLLQTLQGRRRKTTRVTLATADAAARPLVSYLRSIPGISHAVVAGSFRRGQETVGDLDILVTASDSAAIIDKFKEYPEFARIEAAGSTRAAASLRSGLHVDLRVVPEDSFGSALHYFTGSKSHNIAIRGLGLGQGLKINEYGVFQGRRRIAGKTEQEIFAAVGLPYIEPELRENRGEIEAARSGGLPSLVTLSDLKGDLHVHSEESDGSASLRAMASAAQQRGLSYIAITDHSRRLAIAHGLDSPRLRRQAAEIDHLNDENLGVRVFKGIEVDILADGTLDLPDEVLAELDLVVAAVHSGFQLGREAQTARIEKALANPFVTILAHPTGRLLQSREPYDVDMPRLLRAAASHGVACEVNAQPERLDLADTHCRMAKEAGVMLSIASDAHAEEDYDHLAFGIAQARRGWIEPKDVLNAQPMHEAQKFLKRRRSANT